MFFVLLMLLGLSSRTAQCIYCGVVRAEFKNRSMLDLLSSFYLEVGRAEFKNRPKVDRAEFNNRPKVMVQVVGQRKGKKKSRWSFKF